MSMDILENIPQIHAPEQQLSVTPKLIQIFDDAKVLYQSALAEETEPVSFKPKTDITMLFDELTTAGPQTFPGWEVHTSDSVLEKSVHKRVISIKGKVGTKIRNMIVEYCQDEVRGFKKVSIIDMSDLHEPMKINITSMRDKTEYCVSFQNGEDKRNILIDKNGLTTTQSDSTSFSREVDHIRQGQLFTISSGDFYNQSWQQVLWTFDSYNSDIENLQKAS